MDLCLKREIATRNCLPHFLVRAGHCLLGLRIPACEKIVLKVAVPHTHTPNQPLVQTERSACRWVYSDAIRSRDQRRRRLILKQGCNRLYSHDDHLRIVVEARPCPKGGHVTSEMIVRYISAIHGVTSLRKVIIYILWVKKRQSWGEKYEAERLRQRPLSLTFHLQVLNCIKVSVRLWNVSNKLVVAEGPETTNHHARTPSLH
jgi:hypothetical protein